MIKMPKEKSLTELKKEYGDLQKRYSLPSFEKLNEEFDIERIIDKETDFLLRGIRRNISQKAINFMQFLEGLINPNFASMAALSLLKSINEKDKELINKCYEKIFDLELKSLMLEIEYNEKAEAEFIKTSAKAWEEIRADLKQLINNAEKVWRKKMSEEKLNYFG